MINNKDALLQKLEERFLKHASAEETKLLKPLKDRLTSDEKLLSVALKMEETDGEPSFVLMENKEYALVCLAKESPKSRRSFCYDHEALEKRKTFKPNDSAQNFARNLGAKLLNEEEYLYLQKRFVLDEKSSTWLLTPDDIRRRGGAIYGERKYGRVMIGANGADSYFNSRGVRLIVYLGVI